MERRLGAAGEAAARLDQARVRLQSGLALASVLAGGTGETRALVRAVRGIVPRK